MRDNGDVYVALRGAARAPGASALRDTRRRRRGRPDASVSAATTCDTASPSTTARFYFSSATAVYAQKLSDELVPTGEPEIVVSGFGESGGHAAKAIAFDAEGRLYPQAGAPSNACQEADRTPGSPGQNPCPLLEQHAGIWRFPAARHRPDRADGNRDRQGIATSWRSTGTPRRTVLLPAARPRPATTPGPTTTPAEQRAELPAEEFHVLADGTEFGWPYTYWDQIRSQRMVAPEYGGDGKTAEPGKYQDPLLGFPGHWAPNDLLFYTRRRSSPRSIATAPSSRSTARGTAPCPRTATRSCSCRSRTASRRAIRVFADDFEAPKAITSPAEAAHRPTGLAQAPDGALYVSDDVGGRIWKIRYTLGNRN